MFYKAKNKVLKFEDCTINYICFGKGNKNLIIIPGVGDGLKTVKGMAVPFAIMYKRFAKDFKVYVFSRRNDLPDGFSTLDMADDVAKSMDVLGIENASVVGVSQGGMIAQHLAIKYPQKVNKLVLAITSSRPNAILEDSIKTWVDLCNKDDFKSMMIDSAKRSYTEKHFKKMVKLYKASSFIVKPKSYQRYIIQCYACLNHDAYEMLDKITSPTFIVGAGEDNVLSAEASIEIHEKIKGSQIYMFEGYSHGVYEEAKDFNECIYNYLIKE